MLPPQDNKMPSRCGSQWFRFVLITSWPCGSGPCPCRWNQFLTDSLPQTLMPFRTHVAQFQRQKASFVSPLLWLSPLSKLDTPFYKPAGETWWLAGPGSLGLAGSQGSQSWDPERRVAREGEADTRGHPPPALLLITLGPARCHLWF